MWLRRRIEHDAKTLRATARWSCVGAERTTATFFRRSRLGRVVLPAPLLQRYKEQKTSELKDFFVTEICYILHVLLQKGGV